MEFRWKMKLSGLFYQLATLVNKIKSLKFHFPTQFHGNTKISSGKWEIHWFFDKIIEQSTIVRTSLSFAVWSCVLLIWFVNFLFYKLSQLCQFLRILLRQEFIGRIAGREISPQKYCAGFFPLLSLNWNFKLQKKSQQITSFLHNFKS